MVSLLSYITLLANVFDKWSPPTLLFIILHLINGCIVIQNVKSYIVGLTWSYTIIV